jgi:hypothetical protein
VLGKFFVTVAATWLHKFQSKILGPNRSGDLRKKKEVAYGTDGTWAETLS